MSDTGIGARLERKEDKRFITGAGNYTDDINVKNQAYAIFVLSPHAHAEIKGIDTGQAKAANGVLNVFTSQDIGDELGGLICGWMLYSKDGSEMKVGGHPVLATEKVRYVGDHVALVVADTLAEAKAAAELVEVDYNVLEASVVTGTTQDASKPQIHDVAPNNLIFDWHIGEKADVEAAFKKAEHITSLDIEIGRASCRERV